MRLVKFSKSQLLEIMQSLNTAQFNLVAELFSEYDRVQKELAAYKRDARQRAHLVSGVNHED